MIPTSAAADSDRPRYQPAAANAAATPEELHRPSPNTDLRSAHSRDGLSSSPITKSSSTTPSSAVEQVDRARASRRRPMSMPTAR